MSVVNNLIVLVVEDDDFQRMTLVQMLRVLGVQEVLEAGDGQQALALLSSLSPLISVVICDLEMPNMDGISLTRYLRDSKDYAELPLILVTSLENPEDRERGMLAGANAYIVKRGFNQAELLSRIQQLL